MESKKGIIIVVILCFIAAIVGGVSAYRHLDNKYNNESNKSDDSKESDKSPKEYTDTDYNIKLIKTVNSMQDGNYLISPYSIEIALNMLRDGASGDSYKQIDEVIGKRDIPVFNVKDKISVANGAFIKDSVKEYVKDSYYEILKGYGAELIFDPFNSPDKINSWVNEHTNGMIPSILEDIGDDFVMGIANAIAIDVDWLYQFECQNTNSGDFTKTDGKKMSVEMMHATYDGSKADVKYFEIDEAKGIILPYMEYDKDGNTKYKSEEEEFTQLEFVGILPDGNVNDYIESLTSSKLDEIDEKITTTKNTDIVLSLPRFSYSFDYEYFAKGLMAMGIKDVFDSEKADLTNIFSRENIIKMDADNVYVSKAVHKTYIDLNEKGTKAAAVTYFGIDKANAMTQGRKTKKIEFNKPFIYMIRDSKTKEILFFGVVEEPNEWEGSTCSNE